ncbi:MAG: RAMP superfamily CRISPR-associated protein [Propionibacterium acidifaciens]
MRTRYELTVHLRTSSPLHSGGVDEPVDRSRDEEEREAAPRAFARDGHGNPVLTGRSVKGALRAACTRYVGVCGTEPAPQGLELLWGNQDLAAALTFHTIELGEVAAFGDPSSAENEKGRRPLVTRTGIAVNRHRGTAGDTALFAHEYVPAGRRLTLTITAQTGTPDEGDSPQQTATPEQVEQLFGLILGLFEAGRVGFGGRRTAGWGRVELDGEAAWSLTKAELGSREGLLTWLSGGQDVTDRIRPADGGGADRVRISIEWDSPSGILVAGPKNRSDTAAGAADGAAQPTPAGPGEPQKTDRRCDDQGSEETEPARPLRCGPGENDLLLLPGSSVRGALRSRASRIARTVLAARRDVEDWSTTGVHDQLADDPVLVRDLFGSTEHRGALTVLDTLATGPGAVRRVTHNAGDRWTGGVAEGALYSEEVHDVGWNSIELELDPGILPSADLDRRRAAWCLLGLVLAELAAGTLPLGSRGTRGLGQVRVSGVRVEGGPEIIGEAWDLHDEGPDSLPDQILARLRQVPIEPNPAAGDDSWTGWSSYLVDGGAR